MAGFFLRARHWQVFLILVGVDLAAEVALAFVQPTPAGDGRKTALLSGVVSMLFMYCFLVWLWFIGSFLNSFSNPSVRLGTRFFRFALIYPLCAFAAAPYLLVSYRVALPAILPLM